MLSEGMSPNDILNEILGDMELEINESLDLSFKCNCDKTTRSEEHTSELQSHYDIVCRLLLEKKKNK